MTTEPLLSILTPAYNEEPFLEAMVRSLQRQTDDRWELVLVDDGSTDGTADLAERLATEDSRIRVAGARTKLRKVPAFNLAFSASRGTHICHVGADDLVPPHSVEERLASLPEPGERASFGKFTTMDPEGRGTSGPLPRGANGSRSAAGLTMTRGMAERLFPIPEHLVAEDVWLGEGAGLLDIDPTHVQAVIYQYRLHPGNSNPRHRPFPEMNEKMFARSRAVEAILEQDRFPVPPGTREQLELRWKVAQLRHQGDIRGILAENRMPLVDRLANVAMAHPVLWRLRQQFSGVLTGWRGR